MRWCLSYGRRKGNATGFATREGTRPKRSRPRDRDRRGPPVATVPERGREGGWSVGETLYPQAGRPASAMDGTGRTGCAAADDLVRLLACRFVRSPRCAQSDGRVMAATLHVCITCKAGEPVPEGAVAPGALLHAALVAGDAPEGVRIVPVECLSACSQGCSVALSGAGKWSYVYGRLTQDDAADVLAGAAAYAATSDGIVPWRERPVIFRKQSLARIPPLEG